MVTDNQLIAQYKSDFKTAINAVSEQYYYNQRDLEYINSQIGEQVHKDVLKFFIPKYGERLFCYELYHQFRLIIEKSTVYQNVFLQAEIRKDFLLDSIYIGLSIEELSQVFIPDFIIHDPKNALKQHLIIEVKTNPYTEDRNIISDLNKLIEFIEKYKFEHGIFLITNYTNDNVKKIIKDNIGYLANTILDTLDEISIMVKLDCNSELFETILSDIIE